MKVLMVYISPNKTTQRITTELAKHFIKDDYDVIELDIGKKENWDHEKLDLSFFKDADLLGIGNPVYHLTLIETMNEFLQFALPRIVKQNNRIKSFTYITYAGITSGKALLNTAALLKKNGIELSGALKVKAPHFWHLENYPDDCAKSIVEKFYFDLKEKNFKTIDWERVQVLFSYQKPIIKLLYPFTKIIGKLRNQPIDILKEKCIKCKKCIIECPVNAIGIKEYPERNKKKCIYCYHCTSVCPKNAVKCNSEKIKAIVAFNKKMVGLEQPQDKIFV